MPASESFLGFLGHLDGVSLKIQNVGHGCHLLSHTSLTKQWGYALQRHTIQQSTRAALIEPETGWLANGNTHRQPPATYGKPEHRLQHTTVQANQATRPTSPINSALTYTSDELTHRQQNQ